MKPLNHDFTPTLPGNMWHCLHQSAEHNTHCFTCSGYWNRLEYVESELHAWISKHGTPGCMPTFAELRASGANSLCCAIERHGGFAAAATRMGLAGARRANGHWTDWDTFVTDIMPYMEEEAGQQVIRQTLR